MSTSTYYNFTLPVNASNKMAPAAEQKRQARLLIPTSAQVVVTTNDRHSPASFVTSSSSSSTSNSSLNQFNSLASSSSSFVPISTSSTTCAVSPSSCSSSGDAATIDKTTALSSGAINVSGNCIVNNGIPNNVIQTNGNHNSSSRTGHQRPIQRETSMRRASAVTITPTLQQEPSPRTSTRFSTTRSPGSPQLFHSYTLHSLEPKPFKPFKSSNEYLEAMKEDLADWFVRLYPDLDDLNADNFFARLETGEIICRHANNVTQMGRSYMQEQQHIRENQLTSHTNLDNSAALNDCSQHSSKDSSFSERNNSVCNNINGGGSNNSFNDSICSSSLSSPTNDSDSDRGSSIHPSSITSTTTPTLMAESKTADSPNFNHNIKQNGNNGHNKAFHAAARLNDCSNSLLTISDRRASSPMYYSPKTTSPMSYQALDRHSINWFRVKTIPYKQDVSPGTFFARDNICQFILWCRSLNILECLLFETDDLVARKNEKSFILCLLEVARIGFKVGMPTPLIIQLEQEIDREIENDAKLQRELEEAQKQENETKLSDEDQDKNGNTINDCDNYQFNTLKNATNEVLDKQAAIDKKTAPNEKLVEDECDEAVEEEGEEIEEDIGPKPQVITNDLVSLHEKVVQLLCQCTCPTQFPMVRIGDGKYKVGDKLIIFVRILRRHIMVRVGGGWQELSEFLRQKDPCRSKVLTAQFCASTNQYNSINGSSQHPHHQNKLVSSQSILHKSRLPGSTHFLNKGSHNNQQQYRNNSNGQRLISGIEDDTLEGF